MDKLLLPQQATLGFIQCITCLRRSLGCPGHEVEGYGLGWSHLLKD